VNGTTKLLTRRTWR